MPKFQPCPDCHRRCKRVMKTRNGAIYGCSIHGEFLVKKR